MVIPFFISYWNTSYSFLAILFYSSLRVFSVVWAGWGTSSSYSMIRCVRAVAQIISYEVILGFFFIVLFLKTNNLSLLNFFLNKNNLFLFLSIIFLFLVIISAELNRTPFDLVERESELVSGYNVEYSRSLFTVLFLAEYINIIFVSVLRILIFNIKIFFFICLLTFLLIRALLPRFKFSDLIFLCWLVLIPLVVLIYIIFSF